jgi:flagellar basal-body rod modification protein FlgD
MTTPVSGTPLVSPISSLLAASAAASKDKSQLDKDAFLKLLVAQLKYQDPSKPVDSSQFMAQTAQFTQVEKLDELAKDSTATLSLQQGLAASSMVGKSITWTATDGTTHSGTVSSATFGGSLNAEPTLSVGTKTVPLSQVSTVKSAA